MLLDMFKSFWRYCVTNCTKFLNYNIIVTNRDIEGVNLMDKVKMVYGFLCGVGGILIGLFANNLNTILGGGLFLIGIAILVFSIVKLNK